MSGSSPLARGTLAQKSCNTWRGTVHPRSRGEHSRNNCVATAPTGSSPLARGTQRRRAIVHVVGRFIPARAGNTPTPACASTASPVHPRSRGEHFLRLEGISSKCGSSPLARGTRIVGVVGRPHDRFIPARAGNTRHPTLTTHWYPVHPRSRGEHAHAEPFDRQVGRFIPARAGNTGIARARRIPAPVHPRSRGEHTRSSSAWSIKTGSSPLARGTLLTFLVLSKQVRFIPARAGNTCRKVC